jgi:ethanolamine utilization protein EutN
MLLCRVIGRVNADRRAPELQGRRLGLLETVDRSLAGTGRRYVAVDELGASEGQLVLTAAAASARLAAGLADLPVDLAVIAVLDAPPACLGGRS